MVFDNSRQFDTSKVRAHCAKYGIQTTFMATLNPKQMSK